MALPRRPRSSWLASFLSFLVPGLGQAYLGKWPMAAVLVAPIVLLALGVLAIWALAMPALRNQLFSSTFLLGLFVLNASLFCWRVFAISHAGLSSAPAATAAPRSARAPRRSTLGLATLTILLLATAGMHGYFAVMVLRLDTTLGQVFSPPDRDPGVVPGQDAEPDPVDEEPAYQWDGEERINFLLVGVDEAPGRGASLTDTILVLSVDPSDNSAVMVSVPRDTGFVPLVDRSLYPDGLYPGKINELASRASGRPDVWCPGMQVSDAEDAERCGVFTLQNTVSLYLGIPLHYYARIDLLGFERLIDAVGGVDLCLPGRLVDPSYSDPASGVRGLDLPAGCQRYSGADALAYARSRQGWIEMADGTREPQSDFSRADRQQEILLALRDELEDTNLFELPQLLEAVGSLVTTDFPRSQAGDLATLVPLVSGPRVERTVLGYPEYVELPVNPEVNYLLTPRRSAIRDEMERLFGSSSDLEGWYLADEPESAG